MKNYKWLTQTPCTHRGLHDNKTIPENSLLAFQNSVQNGYDIELDVHLTKDGKVVVFHDYDLKRMCNQNVKIKDIDTNKLSNYPLLNTSEYIPLLTQILDIVDKKCNLIIEIKQTSRIVATCSAVWDILQNYQGNYCIESFCPRIVRWWHNNHPQIILGQLYSANILKRLSTQIARQGRFIDFFAVNIANCHNKYFQKQKAKYPHKPHICWTVRTPEQLNKAKKYCDNYIFETNSKNSLYINAPIIQTKS